METGVNGVHGAHVLKHVELDQKLEEDLVTTRHQLMEDLPVLVCHLHQQAVNLQNVILFNLRISY